MNDIWLYVVRSNEMCTAASNLAPMLFFFSLLYKSHFPSGDLHCQHSHYTAGSLLTWTAHTHTQMQTHTHHTNHTPWPECYTDSIQTHCLMHTHTHKIGLFALWSLWIVGRLFFSEQNPKCQNHMCVPRRWYAWFYSTNFPPYSHTLTQTHTYPLLTRDVISRSSFHAFHFLIIDTLTHAQVAVCYFSFISLSLPFVTTYVKTVCVCVCVQGREWPWWH